MIWGLRSQRCGLRGLRLDPGARLPTVGGRGESEQGACEPGGKNTGIGIIANHVPLWSLYIYICIQTTIAPPKPCHNKEYGP